MRRKFHATDGLLVVVLIAFVVACGDDASLNSKERNADGSVSYLTIGSKRID